MSLKDKIEELRAEEVRTFERMKEMAEETPPEDFGAEQEAEFEKLDQAQRKAREARERLERIREMGDSLEQPAVEPAGKRQREQPTANFETPEQGPSEDERKRQYQEAYEAYIRGGLGMHRRLTGEQVQILRTGWAPENEKRAQSVGTTTAGGFAVPDAQMAALEEALLAFGGLRNGPITVLRTAGGNDLPIPTNTDTANAGTILDENTQASDVDSTFGQVVLSAFKFTSGIIKVSQEFLEDASIDVADWAVRAVGTRIARGLAPHLIEGDGSAEPGGLDLAASFVTAAGASAITRDDIIDLIHAVDPAYRAMPSFRLVLGDGVLAAIKKLAVGSSDDRPLWVPSMRDGAPSTIEGVPYVVDQTVADVGAGNRSMYAGDLSKFWLREAGGVRIRRLDERYADFDQVAFVGFARYDSDIIDAGTDPIVYLRHPAS